MSIADTYKNEILEEIIRQILDEGITLSLAEIETRYQAFVSNKDLSKPLFNSEDALIISAESFSVKKYNTTNQEVHRDLVVLYKELLNITDDSIKSFDRWRTEILSMQSQIRNLNTRIDNLLRTQIDKTSNFIIENFVDTLQIDLTNTTAFINLNDHTVSLSTSNNNPTRLLLNNLDDTHVQFTVLSRNNLRSVVNVTPPANALNDQNDFWQTRVLINDSRNTITSELKVQLSNVAVPISRIVFTTHSSNSGGPIQITPLISNDGINFTQLNTSNVTLSVETKGVWSFPSIDVFVVKFIMTKTGYDTIEDNNFVYEFGAQDISFFNENFSSDITQVLISNTLSALDRNNNPKEFDSVELEVCERLPTGTNIDYFISALSAANDIPTWISVDHVNKDPALHPKKINFGNINNITINNIKVSFDSTGSANLINPGANFSLVTLSSGNKIITAKLAPNARYILVNSNERILDYEIDQSVSILENSIEIFRNVGNKGNIDLVRNVQAGWTYQEPYYISAIEINDGNGVLIDFGDQQIILDNAFVKGRATIPHGIHVIKVHKNNWVNIPAGLLTMEQLKANDPLFPFNHKHLIEGYSLSLQENPYLGVDIFAGYYMKQVSIYDLNNNVKDDDYAKFAIDKDVNIPSINKNPSTVFVVKSNENYSDFLDEQFTVRFDVKNQLYKYLKFKAELTTNDNTVTPNLDGYKLKIST